MESSRATFFNVLSVLAFLGMGGVLLYDAQYASLMWPLVLLAIILGYILADAISGFVHFLGDTLGSEHTPLLGKTFIFPFREHHVDQQMITHHTFFVTNGNNCFISLPLMIAFHLWLVPSLATSTWASFAFFIGLSLILGIFATNQIHKWAHMHTPPKLIRFLQHHSLILNPAHHALHHVPPHISHFCITTGWINILLEKIKKSCRI